MPLKAPRPPRSAPGVPRFVSYYRVSTGGQGASGLGLEAQREAVSRHVAGAAGAVVAEFQEIESGKKNDRPRIAEALAACRLRRATLVIAKLDRLARNVHFISNLMESGVDFVACDNPHATPLLIHILAAVAEHEAKTISERTKAALMAAKARGVKLGNPNLRPGSRAAASIARAGLIANADAYALKVLPYIDDARNKAGCRSLGEIAAALTARGIQTPAGGLQWAPVKVARILARCDRRTCASSQVDRLIAAA
jgi:DNA invertase Pin-like site-specific DNA recombinase